MKFKRILAGISALAVMASFAACSSSSEDTADTTESESETTTTTTATEWTGDSVEVEQLDDGSKLDVNIEGKTLKWLGIYDLNPTNDSPDRSPELALFEDTYGATIEYQPTTSDKRFDDLGTAILGGSPPDIFVYEWRTFPYDISKDQYQPIDELVDWEDPKWAAVKDEADKFIYNGQHYIAPLGYSFSDTQVLMYNKTTIENEGFEDPYEMYLNGEWNWNTFTDMMKSFVESGDDRYGIGGWWANAFVYTSGDTIVKYDGETFTNNINSEKIERAQAVIKDIFKNNLIKRGWIGGESAFVEGDLLFYSMGTWAYNAAALSCPDDVIQIVPFPRDPESDTDYVSNKISAYMWVKGSDNADCVKAWFDCNRIVNYDESYKEATKEKFLLNNAGWTSEMYDIAMNFYDSSKFTQAYDYGYGLSTYMADEVMTYLYEGCVNEQYEDWVTAREEYSSIVQSEIDAYSK